MKGGRKFIAGCAAAVMACAAGLPDAAACTRVVYEGPGRTVLTARSMDWKDEIDPDIWVFPRGMRHSGEVGPRSVEWTSKYGSVIASAWNMATTDGMNEKGLVANLLWLAESKYPDFDPAGGMPGLSVSLWASTCSTTSPP